jgi:ABC-type nitrate/sulfonate/bicarbonate transport system permease component
VAVTAAIVLLAWTGLFWLLDLNPYFAKRPWDVWEWLVSAPAAAEHRAELFTAAGETALVAVPGYFAGLALGVLLAAAFSLSARVRQALTPVAVALRCVPIIAIAPLLVAALGRGSFGTAVVVALMTFFPTLVSCLYGLGQLPGQVADVFAAYATPRTRVLVLGRLPAMAPAFFAAARIAAPTALLAATVAEWLATGTGFGNMMAVDAATSRYTSLWSTVVVVTLMALVGYALVEVIERRVLAVVAPEQSRW